jgi:5-hydroxyisourate hydrolase-like protein (transthyretin family)
MPPPGPSAQSGTVTGAVLNETAHQPAVGLAVQLLVIGVHGPEAVGAVRTDARGRFAFHGLASGRYLVQVNHQNVWYAAHALLEGARAADIVLRIYDVSDRVPLGVELLGIAVDIFPGYVRVSEGLRLRNPTTRTFQGDVRLPLPRGAVYITYQDGLHIPSVEGVTIRDRLVVRPGAHEIAYAYSVAGSGDVLLRRDLSFAVDRLEVFTQAPSEARAEGLQPGASTDVDGRFYTRAFGRNLRPGPFNLTVAGVPDARLWPAPSAAGTLAGLLVVGLLWAWWRAGRQEGGRAGADKESTEA